MNFLDRIDTARDYRMLHLTLLLRTYELRRPVVGKYEPPFEKNLPLISSGMRSDPEDGGSTFLRNYVTSHRTRP